MSQFLGAKCGDINSDNKIDIVDSLLIAKAFVNNTKLLKEIADLTGDQNIDIVDALIVAQYDLGIINKFPACDPMMTPKSTYVITSNKPPNGLF